MAVVTSESAVLAGIGGFVGMATALGYGFKLLVDVVAKQLGVQNRVISDMHHDISLKLDGHIDSCKECSWRSRDTDRQARADDRQARVDDRQARLVKEVT